MNIKLKWPSAKRIELMLSTVGPMDMKCPGGNGEQVIPDTGFMALDAMPAMFPGLVFTNPGPGQKFYVTVCGDFVPGGPQYTDSGAKNLAAFFGDYYSKGH
jgi:hypothetical protein